MNSSEHAQQIIAGLSSTQPNLTQLRAIVKEHGKDQQTADELWKHGETNARLLALLMLDLKPITHRSIEMIIADIAGAPPQDQWQLCDWLIANVLMKKSALKREATQWLEDPSIIKQRIFWSVQARTITADSRSCTCACLISSNSAWRLRTQSFRSR